jgi:hypothetical protein
MTAPALPPSWKPIRAAVLQGAAYWKTPCPDFMRLTAQVADALFPTGPKGQWTKFRNEIVSGLFDGKLTIQAAAEKIAARIAGGDHPTVRAWLAGFVAELVREEIFVLRAEAAEIMDKARTFEGVLDDEHRV